MSYYKENGGAKLYSQHCRHLDRRSTLCTLYTATPQTWCELSIQENTWGKLDALLTDIEEFNLCWWGSGENKVALRITLVQGNSFIVYKMHWLHNPHFLALSTLHKRGFMYNLQCTLFCLPLGCASLQILDCLFVFTTSTQICQFTQILNFYFHRSFLDTLIKLHYVYDKLLWYVHCINVRLMWICWTP